MTPPYGMSWQCGPLRHVASFSKGAATLHSPYPTFGQNWRSTLNHTCLLCILPFLTRSTHSWAFVLSLSKAPLQSPDGQVFTPNVLLDVFTERCSIGAKLPSGNGTTTSKSSFCSLAAYCQLPSAFQSKEIRW